MSKFKKILRITPLVSKATFSWLKALVFLPFVLLSYGCKGENVPYSVRICGDSPSRAESDKNEDGFLYPFQVNGVPFKMSSKNLELFSVSKKHTILTCVNPEIRILNLKLSADFSVGIKAPHMASMTIAASVRPSAMLHNYQIPLTAHIKNEKANFYNNDKLALAPLQFKRSSSDVYHCQFCEPFFDFPVTLRDISKSPEGRDVAHYDLAEGTFSGEWAFRLKGVIDERGLHERVLQYSLTLNWRNIEFSELPTVLVDLEKEIQSWKAQ